MRSGRLGLALAIASLLLASCGRQTLPGIQEPTNLPSDIASYDPSPTATHTPQPVQTLTPGATSLDRGNPTLSLNEITAEKVCSPLAEISISELATILTTPFQAPRPGLDDGHHGVDFAYWRRAERETMRGLPVYSMLTGRVAGVTLDRKPYGNMLVIETPLEDLSLDILELLPTPAPTPLPEEIRLTCPEESFVPLGDSSHRSLYLLYAHLNAAPGASLSDPVSCGEQIGEVGSSGASINDHLHLEARLGPSSADIPSMAHYDPSVSPQEQSAYCAWRVTGQFQPIDPMLLFDPRFSGSP